jgi:tetratricopeptide (TPR) repeat protein
MARRLKKVASKSHTGTVAGGKKIAKKKSAAKAPGKQSEKAARKDVAKARSAKPEQKAAKPALKLATPAPKPAKPEMKLAKPEPKSAANLAKTAAAAKALSVRQSAKPVGKAVSNSKPAPQGVAGGNSGQRATSLNTKRAGVPAAVPPPPAPRTLPKRFVSRLPEPPPRPAQPTVAELERMKKAKELQLAEERQAMQYGKAMRHFNSRHFDRALELFKEIIEGPHPTLRHRARVHAKICRQQKQEGKVQLDTAEEYYNYGIKLMNERSLEEAERYLKQALKLDPKAGHVHFARAVLGALSGDHERSYESLKRAIELEPRHRYMALNDADLARVLNDPSIATL